MKNSLNVEGVHCDACVALIKMELEEIGLESQQVSVAVDQGSNAGVVSIESADELMMQKATDAINSMDNYKVV